ncbi:MAG: hypothetical protein IT340_18550 [Chloroflexi bacterium]|nr:hypothetical protein [Chloroflexota bacterium]
MPELIITIDRTTGELHVDIVGYRGPACEEAARLIAAVMGRPPEIAQRKPEHAVRPVPTARAGGRKGG